MKPNVQYIGIIENEGIRVYRGPFATVEDASNYINEEYPDRERGLIEKLHRPVSFSRTIHPNQTTIGDLIEDIHDHVD